MKLVQVAISAEAICASKLVRGWRQAVCILRLIFHCVSTNAILESNY